MPLWGKGPAKYRSDFGPLASGASAGYFGNSRRHSALKCCTLVLVLERADLIRMPPGAPSQGRSMGNTISELSAAQTFLKQLMTVLRRTVLAEMASGVAHELNQPLAAIATYSHAGERMLNRPEPMLEEALDVFKQISHEALEAGERLQDIRRLFEQERAHQQRCQMGALIAELQPTLNTLGRHSDAIVSVDAAAQVPDVRVDRQRIQNVILTLVQNAIDAGANRPSEHVIRIDVSAEQYTVETGVSDSGAGIPPEVAEQIFRPFFTTKPQGTGLGLASSRSIIESHEGTIGFENHRQGGARFWFRLPVAVD
jgi:C4-dicarboxylate-specific signal transduction histidine kinase